MSSAPLCQHIKTNGAPCGCPALKDRRFCHFHDQAERRRRANARRNARQTYGRQYTYQLPLLEDANAIQVAIMETIEALLDGRINHRYAGLVFYALQTASANLKHTTFQTDAPKPTEPWVDEMLTLLRGLPDPNEKSKLPETPGDVLVGTGDLACPGEQSSPRSSSVPSASSALISPPSNGTMTRSPDGTIPSIHAVAVEKDEPVVPSAAETRLSSSQLPGSPARPHLACWSGLTRSRRSRGTCISAPSNGTFHGAAAKKPYPLHGGHSLAALNAPHGT